MRKRRIWWVIIGAVVVVCALATLGQGNNSGGVAPDSSVPVSADIGKPPAQTKPNTTSVTMELSSGHYTAGVDFLPGKYNIEAIMGGGNVVSSNAFSGGINAIMGTPDKNAAVRDMYQQKYSNVSLPDGIRLSISGVTVRITSDAASNVVLKPREQAISQVVTLSNGHFAAGTDFPAGVYDIEAVSGGGNVSSTNPYDGGINAIMGTPDKNAIADMYEQRYKNIDLRQGVVLSVDGVTIKLTPSR